MKKEIIVANNIDNIYDEINALIREKKTDVKKVVNDAIISLNWGIGKRLSAEFTGDNKPEYGKKVVAEVSKRLEQEYGSGFDKTSISRMIKFYQEFPDFEKVATLSQQLFCTGWQGLLYGLFRKQNNMDLLFYHRGLRRLVLVELKLGEFEPQDKGQV